LNFRSGWSDSVLGLYVNAAIFGPHLHGVLVGFQARGLLTGVGLRVSKKHQGMHAATIEMHVIGEYISLSHRPVTSFLQ